MVIMVLFRLDFVMILALFLLTLSPPFGHTDTNTHSLTNTPLIMHPAVRGAEKVKLPNWQKSFRCILQWRSSMY